MINPNKTTEHGRSMTEMLGVLAIIGTLSISGIAGYTYAMNKHRANEIISSVSKMAMTATTEIDLHGNPSLVEFKKGGKIMTDNGYEVDLTEDNGDGTFTLTVKNVPEDVCEKIIGQDWKLPYDMPESCSDGDNAMAFVFTDSLDNSDSGDNGDSGDTYTGACEGFTKTTCITDCADNNGTASYTYADGATCDYDDGDADTADGYCESGYCHERSANGCASNAACAADEFCKPIGGTCNGETWETGDIPHSPINTSDGVWSMNYGTCTPLSSQTGTPKIYNNVNYVLSDDYLIPDAARLWCAKQTVCDKNGNNCHAGRLPSLSELGCTGSGTSWTCPVLETGGYRSTPVWVSDSVPGDSCTAFTVYLGDGFVNDGNRNNDYFGKFYASYALCK